MMEEKFLLSTFCHHLSYVGWARNKKSRFFWWEGGILIKKCNFKNPRHISEAAGGGVGVICRGEGPAAQGAGSEYLAGAKATLGVGSEGLGDSPARAGAWNISRGEGPGMGGVESKLLGRGPARGGVRPRRGLPQAPEFLGITLFFSSPRIDNYLNFENMSEFRNWYKITNLLNPVCSLYW